MGPAIVITIGVLFLLHEMKGGYFDITNTYPVILIVIGMISLAAALASREGHIVSQPPTAPGVLPASPPAPNVPPSTTGSTGSSIQGQGQ
jgi:hypothetical protein